MIHVGCGIWNEAGLQSELRLTDSDPETQSRMTKEKLVPLLASLVIFGAVVWIYRGQSRARSFDLNPYQALGAGTAEETAKLLGSQGSVVVISPDTSESKNAAVDGQLQSFQDTLQKNKAVAIAATVKFKVTPMERMGTGGAVPRDQFLQALQIHPNAGAVVLFCGFPPLDSQDYATLKKSGIKVVVASGYLSAYRKLLESQVIHLAIIPQFETPPAGGKPPTTLRGWFDQDFLVVSAANAATLPY
jgi:hypothetical protein